MAISAVHDFTLAAPRMAVRRLAQKIDRAGSLLRCCRAARSLARNGPGCAREVPHREQVVVQTRQAGLDQECRETDNRRKRIPVANGTSMKAGHASNGRPPLL